MNLTLLSCSILTPVGPMVAYSSGDALCALEFDTPPRRSLLEQRLKRYFAQEKRDSGDCAVFEKTRRWLTAYFAGNAEPLPAPLDMRGTPFEQSVWKLLREIPFGQRVTYGELAQQLRLPQGARAVGGASRRNPISLIVPCHRVVGSTGSLTGYGGGIQNKDWLLRHESQYAYRRMEMLPKRPSENSVTSRLDPP